MGKRNKLRRKLKKGRKREKQKRRASPKRLMTNWEKRLTETDKLAKEAYARDIKALMQILKRYSIRDCLASLFVSDLWLPNISSPLRHLAAVAVVASLKPSEFAPNDRITSYDEFMSFIRGVYVTLPSFRGLEDFVPQCDWGDVYFRHNKQNYRIFYGHVLSNPCDYLELFRIVHESNDGVFMDKAGRSPKNELSACLSFQDYIIASITTQPDPHALSISPGDVSVPSGEFWQQAIDVFDSVASRSTVPEEFLVAFASDIGSYSPDNLEPNAFVESFFAGTALTSLFLRANGRHYPILSRRAIALLVDSWGQLYADLRGVIDIANDHKTITFLTGEYAKRRVRNSRFFQLVSAASKDGPHDIVFACAIHSGTRMLLVYVTPPAFERQTTESHIVDAAPKLREALALLSKHPVTLAHHLDQTIRVFAGRMQPRPEIAVVIPQVSSAGFPGVAFNEELPGRVWFLDQFLGLVDELDDPEELSEFLQFLNETDETIDHAAAGALDRFAAFRASHGVLVPGAHDVDMISIDPNWGSNHRYERLGRFWQEYPQVNYVGEPRSWRVHKETSSRTRLVSRWRLESALFSRVGNVDIILCSRFDGFSKPQAILTDLLLQVIEDSLSANESKLAKHMFFRAARQLQIFVFPKSKIISGSDDPLTEIDPGEDLWASDIGQVHGNMVGIRIVFNDELVRQTFADAVDRTAEVELLQHILRQVDRNMPDPELAAILAATSERAGKPRFKFLAFDKRTSFPEHVSIVAPSSNDFKHAKRRVAQLARERGVLPGAYSAQDAEEKLNLIRRTVSKEIDAEIRKHGLAEALPFLLEGIDAVAAKGEVDRQQLEASLSHEVDYEREEVHAKKQSEYKKQHWNWRYLIEKFVHVNPVGSEPWTDERARYLLALIDWLHVFFECSDACHYKVAPATVTISEDYQVDVDYAGGSSEDQQRFTLEAAAAELGLTGNAADRVSASRSRQELYDALDAAFLKDHEFKLTSLGAVLGVLSTWPSKGEQEATAYHAPEDEVVARALERVAGLSDIEARKIVDFLRLRPAEIVRVLGRKEDCDDIPVWEHRKRYMRYSLRPLVQLGRELWWGPYSVVRCGVMWLGYPVDGSLPANIGGAAVESALEKEKELLSDALVAKTLEVAKRHTPYARKEVELHKLDRSGGHSRDLGDYDALVFLEKANIVLNVECKDLLAARSFRDANSLRETIFGKEEGDEGHFRQINKRQNYLEMHPEVLRKLDWPTNAASPPRIIPVYVTSRVHWWTRFPPKQIHTKFVAIEFLDAFIKALGTPDGGEEPQRS